MSNKLKFAKKYTLLDNGSYERMINRETPSPQFNPLEGEAVRGVKRAHAEMEKALEDPSKSLYDQLTNHSRFLREYLKNLESLRAPEKQMLGSLKNLTTPSHPSTPTDSSTLSIKPPLDYDAKLLAELSPIYHKLGDDDHKARIRDLVKEMRDRGMKVTNRGSIKVGNVTYDDRSGAALIRDLTRFKKSALESSGSDVVRVTNLLKKEKISYPRTKTKGDWPSDAIKLEVVKKPKRVKSQRGEGGKIIKRRPIGWLKY